MELTTAKLHEWRRRAEYTRDNATDPVDRGAALRELVLMDALTEARAQREGNYAMWHDEHDRLVATTAERDALAKKLATFEDQPRQPPQVDWSAAPAFAMWWAADEDGESTWFEVRPMVARNHTGGYWYNQGEGAVRRYARYDLGGYDWTQTLQGRPGVIDMRAAEMGIDAQY